MRKLYEATGGQPQRWESLGNLGAVASDAASIAYAVERGLAYHFRRPALSEPHRGRRVPGSLLAGEALQILQHGPRPGFAGACLRRSMLPHRGREHSGPSPRLPPSSPPGRRRGALPALPGEGARGVRWFPPRRATGADRLPSEFPFRGAGQGRSSCRSWWYPSGGNSTARMYFGPYRSTPTRSSAWRQKAPSSTPGAVYRGNIRS
jgi:hypothetical protein